MKSPHLVFGDEIIDCGDQLFFNVRLTFGIMIKFTAINIFMPNERQNKAAAFVLVLKKCLLDVFRNVKF